MSRNPLGTILIVSPDPETAIGASQNGAAHRIMVVKDFDKLKREMAAKPCRGVVVDEQGYSRKELLANLSMVDPSSPVVFAGPISPLHAARKLSEAIIGHGNADAPTSSRDLTLEDFVETKLGEFVRAMKGSAARTLYPTLIRAVERPLIELVLKETNGNQIQASQLLGMNRNTLRKKITEFNITIKTIKRKQVSGLEKTASSHPQRRP